VIGIEIGGALSAAVGRHHSLFFAGQPLKELFKLAPFVGAAEARAEERRVEEPAPEHHRPVSGVAGAWVGP